MTGPSCSRSASGSEEAVRAAAEAGRVRWHILALHGAAVIAVCYGFARYAFGLFGEEFQRDFSLSATGLGILGGISTAGYAAGLVLGPRVAQRSPQGAVLAAGALSVAGIAAMLVAQGVIAFGAGVALAGSSAGLASPGVAQLINRSVPGPARHSAQTWANTGTSFGLLVTAFTPLVPLDWHWSWTGFCVIAGLVTMVFAAWRGRLSPLSVARGTGAEQPAIHLGRTGPERRELLITSLLLGMTSAPYWNFSQLRLADAGVTGLAATTCWFMIGAAGILGGVAGRVASVAGLRRAQLAFCAPWTLSSGLLALPWLPYPAALVSAALFGMSYMALSGLCILRAERCFRTSSFGVTVSFFGLAIGQAGAAPLVGMVADRVGLAPAFALSAAVSLALLAVLPGRPGSGRPEAGRGLAHAGSASR